jgi:DNA polymerase-3 subunit delta'
MTWQIIGHDWAVMLLRRSLAAGRVAHAYLLTGPPKIGKSTLALALAMALNCEDADPPCGRCRSCSKTLKGVHPDVQLVEGQGKADRIQIGQIRDVQRDSALTPYEGRHRVIILERADRATAEAANSLLKTLEEPPAHVVLVLTAVHPETMPTTVVSRCQRLDLRPASRNEIEKALTGRGASPSHARVLAQLSGGRVGWALDAFGDDTILEQRERDLNQVLALMASDRVERLEFALTASQDPVTARRQIELWTTLWRDVLLLHCPGEGHVVNVDWIQSLRPLAKQTSLEQARSMIRALQTTAEQLESNVNTRLALEGLLLKLPRQRPGAQP